MPLPILVDAARLLMNLGSLGHNMVITGDPKFSKEYIAATVNSMSADWVAGGAAVAKLGGINGRGKTMGLRFEGGSVEVPREPENSRQRLKTAGSIILWAVTVVELLELTIGFGPPAEGDALEAGSQQFATLSAQLKSALPEDGWDGSASEAYADLDTALQKIAQTMAGLDLQLASVVKDQAEWVTHMRLGFGILKQLLIAGYTIELIIRFAPPPLGPVVSQAFAIAAGVLGITVAIGFLTTLCTFSFLNAQKADALATQYTEAAAGAVQKGKFAKAEVAGAAQSTVSSFDAISASMSGMSASAGVSKVAGVTSSSEDGHAALSAVTGAGETQEDSAAEVPVIPEMTMPSIPAITMPTLAQVSAMSGQAAKLSGQLSPHAMLVNQAMGQIQQLAQMGQQGQGVAGPAEETAPEEAALADDVEGDGAASGAAAAERAPIEVAAAGAEAAQQPSPTERTV